MPAPLVVLLVVALIEGAAWIVALPAFQGPDEGRHLAYVQRIADAHDIPFRSGHGPEGVHRLSTEADTAALWSGLGPAQGNLAAKPFWTSLDVSLWKRRDAALPASARRDGGYTDAFRNPPLYYLVAAVPWKVFDASSIFARIEAVKVLNLVLLVVLGWLTWLLAGELLGPSMWGRTLATSLVLLNAQLLNLVATLGPDVLLSVEWAAALLLMVRLVRAGPSRATVAGLLAVCGVAVLTHGRGLPLLAAAALALLLAHRPRGWKWIAAAGGVASAVALLVYAGEGAGNVRQFGSYVWQFYLPRLPGMQHAIGPSGYGVRQAFVDRLFGTFAGLEVTLPSWSLDLLAAVLAIGLAALIAVLVRHRAALRTRWPEAAVLLVAIVALLALVHATAYRTLLSSNDPVIAGRYLVPLLPLFGVAVVLVVRELPVRAAAYASAVVVSAAVVWQLAALGSVLVRFSV